MMFRHPVRRRGGAELHRGPDLRGVGYGEGRSVGQRCHRSVHYTGRVERRPRWITWLLVALALALLAAVLFGQMAPTVS